MDKRKWEYKKLGEVCGTVSNIRWQNVSPDAVYTYVDLSAVDRDSLSIGNTIKVNKEDAPSRAKQIIHANDVLFGTTRPTLKRVCLVNKEYNDCICSTGFCVLRANEKTTLSKWIFYQLLCNRFYLYIEPLQSGANYPAVSDGIVKSYLIPIPPLSEQQHIVEELDLLSSIIEKKKAQLNELDNLPQSLFYEMFGDPITNEKGWEVEKLADITKEKLSYGSGASAIPYDGKLRYIRITDINDSGELNENAVSPNSFDEKYLLNDGDILFARSGATVGKTYYHKEKYGKCIYAGYLIRLIPNVDIVLPSYIFGYTKTQYYMRFVKSAQNAVAQPNINAKQYGNLDIGIPPLSLQHQFAFKIEAIDHQKELIKQSIKEVETLFNSRMDYYFN